MGQGARWRGLKQTRELRHIHDAPTAPCGRTMYFVPPELWSALLRAQQPATPRRQRHVQHLFTLELLQRPQPWTRTSDSESNTRRGNTWSKRDHGIKQARFCRTHLRAEPPGDDNVVAVEEELWHRGLVTHLSLVSGMTLELILIALTFIHYDVVHVRAVARLVQRLVLKWEKFKFQHLPARKFLLEADSYSRSLFIMRISAELWASHWPYSFKSEVAVPSTPLPLDKLISHLKLVSFVPFRRLKFRIESCFWCYIDILVWES